MTPAAFQHDAFHLEQLLRPMINLYRVSTLAADERSAGAPVAYVRQKRMAIKEDIRAFADESEADELFRIKARSLMELGGRYDVHDAAGTRLGVLEKRFGRSLLRSTWGILDASEQEVAWTQERSVAVALARRAIDFVPLGDLVPIPFHFVIQVGEEQIGQLTRAIGFRDRYVLDLRGDPERRIERRVAVALAVALDALQSR